MLDPLQCSSLSFPWNQCVIPCQALSSKRVFMRLTICSPLKELFHTCGLNVGSEVFRETGI